VAIALGPGTVVLVDFATGMGGEQQGRRPGVVVSTPDYLELIQSTVIVVPCTSRDRGWLNHPAIAGETGLTRPTFAMTEQVTMIDRRRILRTTGRVDIRTLAEIRDWLRRWML
jgi:mRNA interferase MazF